MIEPKRPHCHEVAFPAVRLAREAGAAGGTAPAVYNGANEAAVEAFLAGRGSFLGIVDTVAAVLAEHLAQAHRSDDVLTVDDVMAADAWSRVRAAELLAGRS